MYILTLFKLYEKNHILNFIYTNFTTMIALAEDEIQSSI